MVRKQSGGTDFYSGESEVDFDRKVRRKSLRRICARQRETLAFWQAMQLADPDVHQFVQQLGCLIEIGEALIRRLEDSSEPLGL